MLHKEINLLAGFTGRVSDLLEILDVLQSQPAAVGDHTQIQVTSLHSRLVRSLVLDHKELIMNLFLVNSIKRRRGRKVRRKQKWLESL